MLTIARHQIDGGPVDVIHGRHDVGYPAQSLSGSAGRRSRFSAGQSDNVDQVGFLGWFHLGLHFRWRWRRETAVKTRAGILPLLVPFAGIFHFVFVFRPEEQFVQLSVGALLAAGFARFGHDSRGGGGRAICRIVLGRSFRRHRPRIRLFIRHLADIFFSSSRNGSVGGQLQNFRIATAISGFPFLGNARFFRIIDVRCQPLEPLDE